MTPSGWIEGVFRPAVLCAMVACILISLVSLVEMIVPRWDGTYLAVFCTLTAAEAYATFMLLRRRMSYAGESARLVLIELGALFLLLQLCVDVDDGQAPLDNYFPHLDWKTAGLFAFVLIIWVAANDSARDLDRAGMPAEGTVGFVPAERRLASRFFAGGIVLFVLAGLTQARIAQAVRIPNADFAADGPIWNVLLYFLLGVLLLGSTHYAALRARWQRGEITVAGGLGSRWLRYSLVFVGLALIAAFLLPTSHTIGLLDVGRALWSPISAALTQIILTIRGPLTWLLKLFGGHVPVTRPKVIPPHIPRNLTPPPPHHSGHGSGSGINLTVLKSLLFWLVIGAALVYVLRTYLPRTGLRVPFLGGAWNALRGVLTRTWTWLFGRLRGYSGAVAERIPGASALQRRAIAGRPRLPFLRVGSLAPREQIQYYYLNTVQRAGKKGIPRRRSQTPREFTATLAPRLAEAEGDMEALTDAFIQARYSRRDIPPAEMGRIRGSWQRVRAALRGVKGG